MYLKVLAANGILVVALVSTVAAQNPEFEFYGEFLRWAAAVAPEKRSALGEMAEPYRQRLAREGVPSEEINRRIELITTRLEDMEADLWNRIFADEPTWNAEPNAFLISVVRGRKPGRALDVGMGDGRNALHLAGLGWDVTGFDPAEKGVSLATRRAEALGLKLNALIASDNTFDFGREQWDLILYSWVPVRTVPQAIRGLRQNGLIVAQGAGEFGELNSLLKPLIGSLRILRYTDEIGVSDWMGRREMRIVSVAAEKP